MSPLSLFTTGLRPNAWFCCALLFLLPGGTSALRAAPQDPELQLIQKQIAEKLITIPTPALDDKRLEIALAHAGVAEWMKVLGADRRWPDIPYAEKKGGAWPPMIHLARVVEMTKAWVNPANPLHRDPKLRSSIDAALGWWLETNPKSTNWFHNEIRGPQYLGQIFILLGDDANPAQRTESLSRIPLSSKLTGQNLGWMTGNAFMRAVLEDNPALARAARDILVANLAVTPNEGLQADSSFH
ncbi:MAG TPA: hypothetical protein VK968_04535, partial [Roseimicrobium sp.]|nr:hypothetical protein [Roseimicrobium sp.]